MERNLWLLRRPSSPLDGDFFISKSELGEPVVNLLTFGKKESVGLFESGHVWSPWVAWQGKRVYILAIRRIKVTNESVVPAVGMVRLYLQCVGTVECVSKVEDLGLCETGRTFDAFDSDAAIPPFMIDHVSMRIE